MQVNPQPHTDPRQSGAIISDKRFGKRSEVVRKNISLGVKRYNRRNPEEVSALKAKLQDQRLGKPGKSRTTPSWEFVKLRANGASLPATARECGMKLSGVHYRTQALGLPRRCSLCDFEPFVGKHARHLWCVSGLTHSEFAGQISVSHRNVQADVSPKHLRMHIDPERAGKYLAWRNRMLQMLLAEAPGEKGKHVRWGRSSVLKTFFPDLRAMRRLLVETLPALGDYLRAHPQADADELGEWVCDQAQFEKKRNPRATKWRRLLPWLPRLIPTLEKNLALLRRTPDQTTRVPRLWQVALSLLAAYLGVSSSTLQRAMEQKTRQISPDVLRTLILRATIGRNGAAIKAATPGQEKKRGGQRGERKETKARITVAAHYGLGGLTQYAMAPALYPRHKESAEGARNAAKPFFRKYRDDLRHERARLRGLSEMERKAQVEDAEQALQ